MRRLAIVIVASGCSFSSNITDQDAMVDAPGGAGTDASPDAPFPTGPFGTPEAIAPLSSVAYDDDPTLTDDLLEIYFNSDRSDPDGDIWFATRPSAMDAFGAPSLLVQASTAFRETTPEISGDGLTLWFASERGATDDDLYVIARPSRAVAWSTAARVNELVTAGTENASAVAPDGLVMVLAKAPDWAGLYDLYVTTRARPTGPWLPPDAIAGVNTGSLSEESPFLADGGRELYFDSDTSGSLQDLYRARRANPSGAFDPPEPIAELDTAAAETDPWLSLDGRYIVFVRDGEIYEARR